MRYRVVRPPLSPFRWRYYRPFCGKDWYNLFPGSGKFDDIAIFLSPRYPGADSLTIPYDHRSSGMELRTAALHRRQLRAGDASSDRKHWFRGTRYGYHPRSLPHHLLSALIKLEALLPPQAVHLNYRT